MEVQLHTCFDLGIRWRSVVNFMPQPLYPQGNNPWCPLDRRPSGPGRGGEEKNFQHLPGLESPLSNDTIIT